MTYELFFNHRLYGPAYIQPNQDFIPQMIPQRINYVLSGDNTLRASGISDAGLKLTVKLITQLKKLGY